MAGTSLFALLDDIATLLDDIAVLSKVAVKKTAGVLGDDLALNAQQVSGVHADRELPVVWAVAKGSLMNKAILVPAAIVISYFANWAIIPLLMIGGIYLCFEGVEKVLHAFLHSKDHDHDPVKRLKLLADGTVDLVAIEKDKIRGAIRTDFILSAEIIVITLGTVASSRIGTQVAVLIAISLIMTVGVYGLVAGIVKLDDLGLMLAKRSGESSKDRTLRWMGQGILKLAPVLMKTLSVLGTIAMFTVGGGIVVHAIKQIDEPLHQFAHHIGEITHMGKWMEYPAAAILNALVGILLGLVALAVVAGVKKLLGKNKPVPSDVSHE